MAINTQKFIEENLRIKNKAGQTVPLVLNKPQSKLYAALQEQAKQGKPLRAIILKARQQGFSTLTEAMIYKRTSTARNVNSGIVAHIDTATTNLFRMSKMYYDESPDLIKPQIKASNAKELLFDTQDGKGLKSSIKCYTAGGQGIGRSDTFQNLHISEYAFWAGDKADTLQGLLQSVPNLPNTMVIIESTANGYDNFKERWDKAVAGENDYVPIFSAWFETDEYQMPYTGFELTADEQTLKDTYELSNEQITWRRWCIANNCDGNINKFRQEYPSNPDEAFIMSGSPVFDTEKVINRIAELEIKYSKCPYKQGHFSFTWNDAESRDKILSHNFIDGGIGDPIKIYEDRLDGVPYVIGADTKGEGKDFYTATVINNSTGVRVASLRMQLSESKPFTYQLYCLGKYYNDALIGIEMNFNTAPIEELQRLHYPKQYVRQKYDDFTKQVQKKFGWKTDGNTRPIIIDKEIGLINYHIKLFNDITMLRECMTFVYDKNGRPDAIIGKHDDQLFSDMIANEIRGQQTFSITKPEGEKARWRPDQFEDYQNANEEDRKMLLQRWGNPGI
jgi:hypothetical protein